MPESSPGCASLTSAVAQETSRSSWPTWLATRAKSSAWTALRSLWRQAKARADAQSRRNVFFREGDPAHMSFDRPFDAVVGRYVLQFQPDPAAMLRKLAVHVRLGGLIVFHEIDWDGARSFPPSPTYEQCCRWILETLRLLNVETRMGIKLHATFLAAGLRAPTMRLEAVVGGPSSVSDRLHLLANQVETMVPEMERLGVATAAEDCVGDAGQANGR